MRDYRSIMDDFSSDPVHPMIARVYFFLNLTIQMRLDKLDGVGQTIWVGDFCVHATTQGFLEALRIKADEGMFEPEQIQELLSLLQSLNEDELEKLTDPLMDFYHQENGSDFPIINANLKTHLSQLHGVLRQFRQ